MLAAGGDEFGPALRMETAYRTARPGPIPQPVSFGETQPQRACGSITGSLPGGRRNGAPTSAPEEASSRVRILAYDPAVIQFSVVQVDAEGPAVVIDLQDPKTASSGRSSTCSMVGET